MNKQLVILGSGCHTKICYGITQKMNQWDQIIILDDNDYLILVITRVLTQTIIMHISL